jgi:ribokinase
MNEAQRLDIVVVGGANTDYMVRGPQLPTPGEAVTGEAFHTAPGGKGLNQAAAAARLGMRVALVARVGNDDRGDAVVSRLYAEGVETRFIIRDSEARTGVVLVQVDQHGQKQTLSAPGAMARLRVEDVEAAADAIRAAHAVLVQLAGEDLCHDQRYGAVRCLVG